MTRKFFPAKKLESKIPGGSLALSLTMSKEGSAEPSEPSEPAGPCECEVLVDNFGWILRAGDPQEGGGGELEAWLGEEPAPTEVFSTDPITHETWEPRMYTVGIDGNFCGEKVTWTSVFDTEFDPNANYKEVIDNDIGFIINEPNESCLKLYEVPSILGIWDLKVHLSPRTGTRLTVFISDNNWYCLGTLTLTCFVGGELIGSVILEINQPNDAS